VILLDAYALIALLLDEPAGPAVRELLGRGGGAVTTIGLAETSDVLQRRYGIAAERVHDALGTVVGVTLDPLDLDTSAALRAADMRARGVAIPSRARTNTYSEPPG
jgi:uncharacterized protein with PIN domain